MDKQKLILETERLILKHIDPADAAPLIDLWRDPDVTEHLGGPRERAKLVEIFAKDVENPFAYEYDLWPVIEKQSNQVIGHCGLLEKEVAEQDEVEINYIFTPSAWGKGYATEIGKAIIQYAFEEKKLKRLIALIKPENEASAVVATKIGMSFEKEVIRPGGAKRMLYVIEAQG
jgi:RimJ/RimL family protein N-acetyltransferase